MHAPTNRMFTEGRRPVIRWVKGDGQDDVVTRSAIAQATRLFGDRVDYCLTANGISAERARAILAWAAQPVELWMQQPSDNPELAAALGQADCLPERFGYWWKWFPERVRPDAPEWNLDGDMVVVRPPAWFEAWVAGRDPVRVAQDLVAPRADCVYGSYLDLPDDRRLYSGLVSLPPGYRYMHRMLEILRRQPLPSGHDGRTDMDEQGCLAGSFAGQPLEPIPLHEFPFARSYEGQLSYGDGGRRGDPWGYHFSFAFRLDNPHFRALADAGEVFWQEEPSVWERFVWLRNFGQWGWHGWSMQPAFVAKTDEVARTYAGKRVLDSGTSRGHLAAILATHGCHVTTVDAADRGAAANLDGLDVQVVVSDLAAYLRRCREHFDLMVIDLHGNGPAVWRELWPLLVGRLATRGRLLLYNSHLWRQPEALTETGLKWVMENRLWGWKTEMLAQPAPGMIICHRGRWRTPVCSATRAIRSALTGAAA